MLPFWGQVPDALLFYAGDLGSNLYLCSLQSHSRNDRVVLRSIVNRCTDRNTLFDQNFYTSTGDFTFDSFDFFFAGPRRRINPYMAVLVFESLRGRLDLSFRTEPLG